MHLYFIAARGNQGTDILPLEEIPSSSQNMQMWFYVS